MMRKVTLSVVSILFVIALQAQNIPARPTEIITGKFHGISQPLRDLPAMTPSEFHQLELKGLTRTLNKGLRDRYYPYASTALPQGNDPIRQNFMGSVRGNATLQQNFDGQTSPYYPPDCNGTAGPNHFMQTINCVYAIYDKTGGIVAGPTNLNLLFGSVPGANRNDGDPIILYDDVADRWLVTEFSIPMSGPNYVLMAVSTTNDPTGTWYQYSFQVSSMPDYPKFSVWRDGYYMGDNNSSGNDIYVFQREQMLVGGTAQAVGFNNPYRPASVDGFMCVPPIDNDGPLAPEGMPGLYIAFNDDAIGGGSDQLWLYELDVDWTTPAGSTFNRTQQIDVQPFNCNFGNNWNNIDQKGVSQRVDGIPQVIMNVPQYRNFGSYQTIVCCHTVNIDGIRHAGIRWYELRKTTGNWEVRQQGTYAPDSHSRWMGSIMLNGYNEIGLGYSVSSTTMYPSIFYTGQSAGAYNSATGILDIEEDTIWMGSNSQTGANRWGDYSQVSVDPQDDKTFWFTTQYIGSGSSRKTRIASFKYNFAPLATTQPATTVAYNSATLNGKVCPNGIETTCHFEYGNTPVSLNMTTPPVAVGAGYDTIPVSAVVTGLFSDTSYFFRIVAESSGGIGTGLKIKFSTPAAPFLAVTPENQNVPDMAGNTGFLVSSNTTWSVSNDAAWCTATPSGSGNDTIHVTCEANQAVALRLAHLSVTGDGAGTRVVTVTQAGAAPMLSVTPPNRDVTAPAGNTTFEVLSNTDWNVTADMAWCTFTTSGSGNGTITATYEENLSVTPRVCTLQVAVPGFLSESVTVTQAGAAPILSVTPTTQNVNAVAGSTAFTVTSNTDWSVTGGAAWCTFTQSGTGNGTIVADYTQNTSDQPRTASLDVAVQGLPAVTVTVNQARSGIGVDETRQDHVRIFPNPTRGLFTLIPATGSRVPLEVTVQDAGGRVVLTKHCQGEKEYPVDLSGAPQGTYNIVVKGDSFLVVTKLVVIR